MAASTFDFTFAGRKPQSAARTIDKPMLFVPHSKEQPRRQ
jgi:hypothetical protein